MQNDLDLVYSYMLAQNGAEHYSHYSWCDDCTAATRIVCDVHIRQNITWLLTEMFREQAGIDW
jgi:hypothetical protein